jgi:radical SAM superfamily enzyme YgiQ (UPF0313 family)
VSEQLPLVRLVAVNPDAFSLGLAYLDATLTTHLSQQVRVEQAVYDLARVHSREVDLAGLAADIVTDGPVLVGFSWYCWNHRLIQDLAALVHGLRPECQIVVGGPETGTIRDAELAIFPLGTVFVIGEGEGTLTALVSELLRTGRTDVELPAGTARRDESGLTRAPRRAAALAVSEIVSPVLAGTVRDAASEWLPSYATTRGCVFKCSFCAWQDGFREREFDLDVVFKELDVLATRNYERIWITDTIFGRNEARALAIVERLQHWPRDTRFAVELHAKYLSARLAEELAKVQLAWAAIGIQSLAPDVLRLTRRSPHTTQLLEAVGRMYQACSDRSVIHLDIIFGLPHQTVSDCFETVDLLLETFPEATVFTGMLQVIPGTAVEALRDQPGWVVLPPEGDFEVAATPDLCHADMSRVRDLAAGLDAYTLGCGPRPGSTRIRAADLEELGRSLRHTAFGAHPIYGRRERFTAAQVTAWARAGEHVTGNTSWRH